MYIWNQLLPMRVTWKGVERLTVTFSTELVNVDGLGPGVPHGSSLVPRDYLFENV